MPFGMKPVCSSCRVTTSTLWRKGVNGEILCNSCGLKQSSNGGKDAGQNGNSGSSSKNENGSGNGNHSNNSQGGPVLRKSARIKPAKSKVQTATKALATKGKSRRIIFKKSVRRYFDNMSMNLRMVIVGTTCIQLFYIWVISL